MMPNNARLTGPGAAFRGFDIDTGKVYSRIKVIEVPRK
jgi:hypothetical protein